MKKTTQHTFERRDYGPKLKANLTLDTKVQSLTTASHGYSLRRRASYSDLPSAQNGNSGTGAASQPIPVSNGFDALSMEDDDNDISSISTTSISGDVDIRVKKAAKTRCPPITVRNKSAIEINRLISRVGGGGGNYSLRNFEKAVQIKVKCAELFQKITAELKQINAEFFTHAKPEEALVKIVLSGLPLFEIDYLIEELEKNNICPRDVKVLSKSDDGNRALYLLNFPKGTVKLTQLREVKCILNVVVWWRFYTRKNDVMQCFRCQGFGHGSRYCNMTPRCVKCGGKHGSNECQLPTKAELEKAPKSVRQKVKCANCNLNHTANFKDCTARKDYLKHQEKKKPRKASAQAEQGTSQRKFTSKVVAPGLSFANITAGSSADSRTRASAEQKDASQDNLFTVTEFLGLAREMYASFSNCATREDQFFALHELMVRYIYVH